MKKVEEIVIVLYQQILPLLIFLYCLSTIATYDNIWQVLLNLFVMITAIFYFIALYEKDFRK